MLDRQRSDLIQPSSVLSDSQTLLSRSVTTNQPRERVYALTRIFVDRCGNPILKTRNELKERRWTHTILSIFTFAVDVRKYVYTSGFVTEGASPSSYLGPRSHRRYSGYIRGSTNIRNRSDCIRNCCHYGVVLWNIFAALATSTGGLEAKLKAHWFWCTQSEVPETGGSPLCETRRVVVVKSYSVSIDPTESNL